MGVKLPREFYEKDAPALAKDLLGQVLCRRLGDTVLKGRIVETEAYAGVSDKACHAYGGRRTPRTEILYGKGGFAYVYHIYGIYWCMNVVGGKEGDPQCVFLRALEPLEGLDLMRQNRGADDIKALTTGPGKLCRALSIDKSLYGADLRGEQLWIEQGQIPARIAATPRINIDYAEEDIKLPYRFVIQGNPYLSKK
jgi:DNA-3-methyladenine glycosylase